MNNKEAIAVLKSNYPHGRVMLSEAVDLSIKTLEAAESQTTVIQQLKAEILRICDEAEEQYGLKGMSEASTYFGAIRAKLSAV